METLTRLPIIAEEPSRLPPATATARPRPRLELFGHTSRGRRLLETEIRERYAHHFGARIEGFMPWLLRFTPANAGDSGVLGLRPASGGELYLESYLDAPIERYIESLAGRPVARSAIVEIGQLAVEHRSVVVPFFRALVPFLREQGYRWVCFTATGPVRALLARAGLSGSEITAASAERVAGRGDEWGSYYQHDPRVIVGDLTRPGGFAAAGRLEGESAA